MPSITFYSTGPEKNDSTEMLFNVSDEHYLPLYGKPKEIGFFSVDAKRTVHFNRSQLRYLVSHLRTKNLYFDLNANINVNFNRNFIKMERMHNMLRWMLNSQDKVNFDFATVRGTLTSIACTPYTKGSLCSQWEICATKHQGIIYFCAVDSDCDIEEEKNKSPKQAMFEAWGYKFEQYLTTDTNGEQNLEPEAFQLQEFCVVLKNVLGSFSLVYTAEIDAVLPHQNPRPESGSTMSYIELKTSRFLSSENHKYKFYRPVKRESTVSYSWPKVADLHGWLAEAIGLLTPLMLSNIYKVMRWWAQSFFTGIPEIICGLRNDDGIVKELQFLSVDELPENCKGLWSSDTCLSFCIKFLSLLKRTVVEDNPNIVYKFNFKSDEDSICCSKMINPEPRYRVIPEWYIKCEDKV